MTRRILPRLPRDGETVQFWRATPNILDNRGNRLPEGQYLVTIEGPECVCEEEGIGKPKWYSGCPIHGIKEPVEAESTLKVCAECGTSWDAPVVQCPECGFPREPQEDDSLAQESVSEEEEALELFPGVMADLISLLGNEGDARIVAAYLIGYDRHANTNDA